jgi:hypothetical protein
VHTAHGAVTLAFEDSAEAQLWFAALKDVVTTLKQVRLELRCVTPQITSVPTRPPICRVLYRVESHNHACRLQLKRVCTCVSGARGFTTPTAVQRNRHIQHRRDVLWSRLHCLVSVRRLTARLTPRLPGVNAASGNAWQRRRRDGQPACALLCGEHSIVTFMLTPWLVDCWCPCHACKHSCPQATCKPHGQISLITHYLGSCSGTRRRRRRRVRSRCCCGRT